MKRGGNTVENRAVVADYLGQSDAARTFAVVQMRLHGSTRKAIAEKIGVTEERVGQILAKFEGQLKWALLSIG